MKSFTKISLIFMCIGLYSGKMSAQHNLKSVAANINDPKAISDLMKNQRLTLAEANQVIETAKKNAASGNSSLMSTGNPKSAKINLAATNLDFEDGTTNGWTISGDYKIVSAGVDSFGGFSKSAPGGTYSLQLGNPYPRVAVWPPDFAVLSAAQQTFRVSSVNPLLKVQAAFDILDFGHQPVDAAYVQIEVDDSLGNQIACKMYSVYDAAGGPPGFRSSVDSGYQNTPWSPYPLYPVVYAPWRTFDFDLSPYIGTNVTFKVTNSWCRYNYDWVYCYIDASCTPPNLIAQKDVDCGSGTSDLCAPAGMDTYTWTGPVASNVSGKTTACVNTGTAGSYSVVCASPGGCVYTYSFNYTPVTGVSPVAAFNAIKGCSGVNSFTDASSVASGNISSWTWDFGDSTAIFDNHSSSQNPTYSFLGGPGIYSVKLTVKSDKGCESSITKPVEANIPPNIGITTIPAVGVWYSTLCKGTSVTLSGTGALSYTWTGGISDGVSFKANSNYKYIVTGTDANGCTGKDSIAVSVSTCTGVNQVDGNNAQLAIYPNPADASFVIEFNAASNGTQLSIESVSGALIYKEQFNAGYVKKEFEPATLAKGIYFVKIQSADEWSVRKLLIE